MKILCTKVLWLLEHMLQDMLKWCRDQMVICSSREISKQLLMSNNGPFTSKCSLNFPYYVTWTEKKKLTRCLRGSQSPVLLFYISFVICPPSPFYCFRTFAKLKNFSRFPTSPWPQWNRSFGPKAQTPEIPYARSCHQPLKDK
jgi:hypothetical protein